MKPYKCLLFDLDRTLWDVERNQKEALRQLYAKYDLRRFGTDFERCFYFYERSNNRLWDEYRDGNITREALRHIRFEEMLSQMGVDDPVLTKQLGEEYIHIAPTFTHLIPHAREVVHELSLMYPLYIVTNGFTETQHRKLAYCGLSSYFRGVVCSEEAGANKPSPVIFEYALRQANVSARQALFVGDDPQADIQGAYRAGIDSVWFDPFGGSSSVTPTYRIVSLSELPDLLNR